ncbi:MAG TPA: glycosyltransferase family 1 protein [Vicinamibacterales bacterium]|nr:glycosyltransferase family 1 protein [Vicinamibacterales bacterium]
MRILIDYRPALRQRTGVGEYAHSIAGALVAELDPASTLVLFSSSWKDRLPPAVIPGAESVDARVPVRILNRLWHRFEWPAAETFAGPIDVAHSMHPLLLPSRRAAQVVTIHDLYFLDRPESTAAEVRRDYAALAARHARRADAVIVVSEYTALQVQSRLDVPPERITICPPGAPAWEARPWAGNIGPILFVGTIEPRKNVGRLLSAYRRLVERMRGAPPLLLAGRVTPESAALLAAAADPPLAGRVRHLGYVSDEQRQQLYRQASLLVLPSLNEGFGLPALEAMTIGVPVVAANRGALPELLGDAGLLIEPEDEAGMASAMERLLSDEALAQRCGRAGRVRSQRFSWRASAQRLLRAYEAALERHGGQH